MIRKLTVQDAEKLHEINKEQLGYDFPLDATEKKLIKLLKDSNHHFFLGVEEDTSHRLLGYVHAEVYEAIFSDPLFNVMALAVSKESEHKGIGKQLMESLEKEAVKRNYEAIRLNSGMNREDAHQFYEAIGYDNDKNQKRFIKYIDC